MCEHVEKGDLLLPEEPTITKIWTLQDKELGHYMYTNSTRDFPYGWMIYAGLPNGEDFINVEWKQKALDFLGGEWL